MSPNGAVFLSPANNCFPYSDEGSEHLLHRIPGWNKAADMSAWCSLHDHRERSANRIHDGLLRMPHGSAQYFQCSAFCKGRRHLYGILANPQYRHSSDGVRTNDSKIPSYLPLSARIARSYWWSPHMFQRCYTLRRPPRRSSILLRQTAWFSLLFPPCNGTW